MVDLARPESDSPPRPGPCENEMLAKVLARRESDIESATPQLTGHAPNACDAAYQVGAPPITPADIGIDELVNQSCTCETIGRDWPRQQSNLRVGETSSK